MIIHKIICKDFIEVNNYLIFDEVSRKAIIIDLTNENEVSSFIEKNKLIPEFIILTHEHYDHISGVNSFRKKYIGCKLVASVACNENIQNEERNISKYLSALFCYSVNKDVLAKIPKNYRCMPAEIVFEEKFRLNWLGNLIEIFVTPGHSPGSVSIVINDMFLFTGDSLLLETKVITRFPGGSKASYLTKTLPFLKNLSNDINVYPGHGSVFRLGEKNIQNEV